jgi:FecR protein/Bacterial Ig-like domain
MHRDVRFDSDPHAIVMQLPLSEGPAPDRIVIDDTRFLFTAHFKKSGADLILTDDSGKKLVVVDYFNLEKHPDLVSPDGAIMSGDLVGRLAGPDAPGQYAQAGAPAGAQVIGRVELVGRGATVQHVNGAVDSLKAGDALLKGDVVMTADGDGLTLSLIDGTALNMGANARMVLAELAYDSNSTSTSNSALISLVKGSFTFVAGQVAHTGDMKVTTPIATMGIRGTTVGAYLDADINGNVYEFTATLLSDPGGGNGQYDVLDPVTGEVVHRVTSTAAQVTLRHAPNNQLLVQEASKSPAVVQHELAVAQILFPIFLANPANQVGQPATPQPPNNSLTPPQFLPQPPQETDPNFSLHINTMIITTADKTTEPGLKSSFIATDTASNTNTTSTASISIAAIDGNNIVNSSNAQAGFVISGSEAGADGQTVTVTILDGSSNVVGNFTTTAGGGAWSVQVSPANATTWADGSYKVTASVSGTDGNPAPPATQTLTVDETPPAAPGVALAIDSGGSSTDHITSNAALTLAGTETGAIVQYSVNNGQTWTSSFTAVEGANTVQVRQTDVAGNISSPTSFSFTLDTIAPAAPGVALAIDSGGSSTDHITSNAALTLAGTETGAIVQYSINGGQTWSTSFTAVEGVNTVQVRQTDIAGDVSSATSFSFTLDTLAPLIAIGTIAGDNSINTAEAQAGFAISGSETGADGQTVTVTIVDDTGKVVDNYTTTAGGDTWSVSVTGAQATALAEGSYMVTASVSDAAGNSATATRTLTVDEETDTWVSASNANWSAASHWSNGVPTNNTDVVINVPGTYTISISQPAVAGTLTVDALGATVKDNVSLILSGALKVSSGTFELNNGNLQTTLISIGLAGIFLVEHGTYALSAPIANDGQFVVESNGTLVDITGALSGLGSFTISSGATLQFGTGWHTISGSVTDNGTVEVTDGTLEIAGACSGTGTLEIDAGATLQLDGADALNVAFAGSTGRLVLKDPAGFTGTIAGLTGTDAIDLANIDWATAQLGRVTYNASTNITTLVITDGQHTDTIQLIGDYTSSTWTFSSDGKGGTLVVDPITSIAALDASEDVLAVAASASSSDSTDSSGPTSNDDTLIGASDISASSTWASDLLSAEFEFGADHIRFGSKGASYFARLDAGHDSWFSQAEWQVLLETPAAFNGHAASPASALAMQASNMAAPVASHMNDYFQFVDTNAGNGRSDPPSNAHSDSPSIELPSQAAAHGPFDNSPGTPNNHADDPSPPIWAHNALDQGASPASKHVQFEDVKTGNGHSDPPSIELPSQAAAHGPFDNSPGTPNKHADDPSPPIWTHNALDHGASPASKHVQFENVSADNETSDPHHMALPDQSTLLHTPAEIPAVTPNNHAASPLLPMPDLLPISNMASGATQDHFHFADMSASDGIPHSHVAPLATFDLQQTTLQEIIDAAAPANHVVPAAPNEVLTFAGVDSTQMQAHQGSIHAHAGLA